MELHRTRSRSKVPALWFLVKLVPLLQPAGPNGFAVQLEQLFAACAKSASEVTFTAVDELQGSHEIEFTA